MKKQDLGEKNYWNMLAATPILFGDVTVCYVYNTVA